MKLHLWFIPLAWLFLGCQTPPVSLGDLRLEGQQAVIGVNSVDQIQQVNFSFNGSPETWNPATTNPQLALALAGRACYGKNQLDLEVKALSGNKVLTLKRSYTFDYKPTPPTLKLSPTVQGVVSQNTEVAVELQSTFRYGCTATLSTQPESEPAVLSSAVPGNALFHLPALNQEGDYPFGLKIHLGDWETEQPFTLHIGSTPPSLAHLTVVLEGPSSALLTVIRNSNQSKVFEETINASKTLELDADSYTLVGGQVNGYTDPLPATLSLSSGQSLSYTLKYAAGPPPIESGVSIQNPIGTILEPRFEIRVKLDNPGLYSEMYALFDDSGTLASWLVSGYQDTYSQTVTLNPEQYNGPHSLRIRLRKGGQLVNGPAQTVTMQVPWNAGKVVFGGVNSGYRLEVLPSASNSLSFSGTITSVNGYTGPVFLNVLAPTGVSASVSPTQTSLIGNGTQTFTLSLGVTPSTASGIYAITLESKDQWDIKHSYVYFDLTSSRKPVVSLSLANSPLLEHPVPITAQVSDDGTLSKVEFYLDGTLQTSDSTAPYTWKWEPGLDKNGSHTLRAVAIDSLEFSGESSVARELKLPFGIRKTADLKTTPTAGPVVLNGFIYLGGGSQVWRVNPADLSLNSYNFGGQTVKALLVDGGKLYAATNTQLYEMNFSGTPSAKSVWTTPSGDFAGLKGSPLTAAYGSVIGIPSLNWQVDVGEAIRALEVSGGSVFVATDTRLLQYEPGNPLARYTRHASGVLGLEAAYDHLWVMAGTTLEPTSLSLNPIQSPEALQTADWKSSHVLISPDFANAPDGRKVADRVTVDATKHSLGQTLEVLPDTPYTFSFYAKNNSGEGASYAVDDLTHNAELIPATSYFDQLGADWTRVSVSFTTPPQTTQITLYPLKDAGPKADLLLYGVRLDLGDQAKTYSPVRLAGSSLCGTPTGWQLLSSLWIIDNKGCLTKVTATGTSRFYQAANALAFAPTEDASKLYLAQSNGTLFALDSTGKLLKQETPSSNTPVLGISAFDYLIVPYANGKVLQLDKLP